MNALKKIGWIGTVLMALSLVVMPVAVTAYLCHSHLAMSLLLSLVGVAGTVTVTYPYPVNNSTVGPTAVQAAAVNEVVAAVQWQDADTLALVTHNFALGTVNAVVPPGLAPTTGQLFPEVNLNYNATQATTSFYIPPTVTVGQNTITLGKNSVTGSGGTVVAYIHRPHSLVL